MAISAAICMKLTLAHRGCVRNDYTEFHENTANDAVVIKSCTDGTSLRIRFSVV